MVTTVTQRAGQTLVSSPGSVWGRHLPAWSSSPPIPEPFPSELPAICSQRDLLHLSSSLRVHPTSVSAFCLPKTTAKGLLSFMSNQPKFVPRPQFDQLSSEAAIWEDFCCSSSFQKHLCLQGSQLSLLMLMDSITGVIYAGLGEFCSVARPRRNYLTSRGRRKPPPGKWLQLQRPDRDAT